MEVNKDPKTMSVVFFIFNSLWRFCEKNEEKLQKEILSTSKPCLFHFLLVTLDKDKFKKTVDMNF